MSNDSGKPQSTPLHSVSVAGVVVRADGRALAIRRADNGTWEPPGGVLELFESIEDGVRREVYEETGIKVAVDRLTGVYKNTSRGIVALVFRCCPEGGAEQLSAESTAVDWLTPAEVSERMAEVYAVRLLDALREDDAAPSIRTHDGRHVLGLQLRMSKCGRWPSTLRRGRHDLL
ncbi:NUDIX hydrolase [Kitasatospora sp. NBC_00085]|uniref:NUDIX hydrolase n=1 Tax=unclassified Kitasatospora TaxID=2633591 RepID=UPI003244AB30